MMGELVGRARSRSKRRRYCFWARVMEIRFGDHVVVAASTQGTGIRPVGGCPHVTSAPLLYSAIPRTKEQYAPAAALSAARGGLEDEPENTLARDREKKKKEAS